jgi:hypothetical protein
MFDIYKELKRKYGFPRHNVPLTITPLPETFEPSNDKTNIMCLGPAWIQT